MGVDPEEVFEIVHRANMGKIFPDGKAHFDPVTHKILKPDDWEEKPRPRTSHQKELDRQPQGLRKHAKQKKQKTTKKSLEPLFQTFSLSYMVLSLSRTTCKSTLAWRRIYSEEDPTINRSKALSPVAPTIIRSTPSLPGISLAKRTLISHFYNSHNILNADFFSTFLVALRAIHWLLLAILRRPQHQKLRRFEGHGYR